MDDDSKIIPTKSVLISCPTGRLLWLLRHLLVRVRAGLPPPAGTRVGVSATPPGFAMAAGAVVVMVVTAAVFLGGVAIPLPRLPADVRVRIGRGVGRAVVVVAGLVDRARAVVDAAYCGLGKVSADVRREGGREPSSLPLELFRPRPSLFTTSSAQRTERSLAVWAPRRRRTAGAGCASACVVVWLPDAAGTVWVWLGGGRRCCCCGCSRGGADMATSRRGPLDGDLSTGGLAADVGDRGGTLASSRPGPQRYPLADEQYDPSARVGFPVKLLSGRE